MQAISSTSAVAAVRAVSAGRYAPTISSSSGTTRASLRPSASAAARAMPAGIPNDIEPASRRVRTSVAACSAETPGARRPRPLKAIMITMRGCPATAAAGGANGGTTSGVQNSPSGLGK